jgi:hypothetical protein
MMKQKRSANYHVRQTKYEYERSIATNMKEDNKIFWKCIQPKTKSKENISCIMGENGEVQMNNKIKAELLNKFFQSVFAMETIHPFFPQVVSLYQRWLGKRLFSDKRL